jgi:hypothetical protein
LHEHRIREKGIWRLVGAGSNLYEEIWG